MRYIIRVYARPFRGWFYLFYFPTCRFRIGKERNDYVLAYYLRVAWFEIGFSSLPY